MESSITQRIIELYNSTGYKSVRLWASILEIPYTTLSEIMRGAEPRYTTIKCILDGNPLISAEWLLRGEGEMKRASNTIDNPIIEELKAEINQLKGENRILREQAGLGERKESDSRSA